MKLQPDDAIDPARLRRVLVIKLRHHGDVLLTSPVLQALQEAAPQAEIDALVYVDSAAMLSLHPALSQLHCVDRSWRKLGVFARLWREWRLLAALRARHYDLLIDLTASPRGAWLARRLGCATAVAPDNGRQRRGFTHRYPTAGLRHVVELHLDALRRIGIQASLSVRQPRIVPGLEAEQVVDAHLARLGLKNRPFIHLHPTSRWQFKCWTVQGMAGLIRALVSQGHAVVVTAAPEAAERARVAEILAAASTAVQANAVASPRAGLIADLSGQLSLKQLAALSARARLFVGVDSAPMHIAAASGTPVVALFGPSGDVEWGPWGSGHRVVVSAQHACRPCGQDGCGGGKLSECLTSLTLAQVQSAVFEALATQTTA